MNAIIGYELFNNTGKICMKGLNITNISTRIVHYMFRYEIATEDLHMVHGTTNYEQP